MQNGGEIRGDFAFDIFGNEVPCLTDFFDIGNMRRIEDARLLYEPMFYGVTLENGNTIYA